MPYDDLRWMGGIGMIGTRAVYNAIMQCDLLLMVGTDYPFSNFLPTGGNVIQIDDRPQALGRRAPTALGAVGSAKPTLKLLLERVAPKNDTAFFDKVTTERRKWDEMLVLLLQGARYSLRKRPPRAHAPDPEEGNHQASWGRICMHRKRINVFTVLAGQEPGVVRSPRFRAVSHQTLLRSRSHRWHNARAGPPRAPLPCGSNLGERNSLRLPTRSPGQAAWLRRCKGSDRHLAVPSQPCPKAAPERSDPYGIRLAFDPERSAATRRRAWPSAR